MIRDIFSSVGDVQIFPLATLILFVTVFGAIVYWAFGVSKPYLRRMSRLPLDEGASQPDEGDEINE